MQKTRNKNDSQLAQLWFLESGGVEDKCDAMDCSNS